MRTSHDKVDGAYKAITDPCFLAKIDIPALFRPIPLDPADRESMAFTWDGVGYADKRLNFGQRNAPELA